VQKSIEDRFQEMNSRSASKGDPVDQTFGIMEQAHLLGDLI